MYLIIGGSGNAGREVTRQLAAAGEPVRVLSRDPARAQIPDGVEVVQGDLGNQHSLESAMRDVTRVYSLMRPGTAGNLAAAAKGAGVQGIVLLTSLAAAGPADTPMGAAHRQAEAEIKGTGIPWTFLRPTNFASNSLAWAPSIRAEGIVRAPFGSFKTAVIDPRDIAAVAVAALTSTSHAGQAYPLTGPEALSVIDQVSAISDVLGRDIAFAEQPEQDARQEMLQRGMPAPVVESLLASQRAALSDEPRVFPTVEEVSGRAPFTYRDWVTYNLPAFS